MMNENVLLNNRTEIVGVIDSELTFSHEVYGEGFYNFNIKVPRFSENADILPVTVSERLCDREIFTIGTNVLIVGQIRSYNNYLENDKKNKLVLTIFAREISLYDEQMTKYTNNVYLNGFICKPPVYRQTPFGREITDILLAVNRSYSKSDYIPCIAWGRNAKFSGKFEIGDNLEIYGRIQSRIYQKKLDDENYLEKTAYEVSISKIEIVSKKTNSSIEE